MAYVYTGNEKHSLVDKVNKLNEEGYKIKDACQKLGLNTGRYYVWSRKGFGSKPTSEASEDAPKVIVHEEEPRIPRTYRKTYRKKGVVPASTSKCLIMVTDITSAAQLLREFT